MIIIFFLIVFSVSCQWQKEDTKKEMKQISSQIEKFENIMRENNELIQKLKMHESRLRVTMINPKRYRIPVLIVGQLIFTTVDETELEELSYSLALEDLLKKSHATKGGFRSDNPSEWKKYLIEQSKEAADHLNNDELPAIQRRISALDEDNQELELKRGNLLEKYKALQVKAQGS